MTILYEKKNRKVLMKKKNYVLRHEESMKSIDQPENVYLKSKY